MEANKCLDCGNELKGRSDKKFCDDQCRSHYHNRLNEGRNRSQRPLNGILRKNHSVLSKLFKARKSRIGREELLQLGFNLNFHTHSKTIDGETFQFCYEYGYRENSSGEYLIMRSEAASVT